LIGGLWVFWSMKWQLAIRLSLQTNLFKFMKKLFLER